MEIRTNPIPPGVLSCLLGGLIGLCAFAGYAYDLPAEPHFVDESAYISQSYFADLFLAGKRDDRLWLEYPAIDLPPLPKYMIGWTLRARGWPRPSPEQAKLWYRNTHYRPVGDDVLVDARLPSVLCGAMGVVALYALGTMAAGRWAGLLASAMLMINPLYRLHARRAMSDVPAEAFLLLTLALGYWAWVGFRKGRKSAWIGSMLAGVSAGLAVESKLNGGLGMMVLIAWAQLGLVLPNSSRKSRFAPMAGTALAGLVALGTFVSLNPALTARPSGPLPSFFQTLSAMGWPARTWEVVRFRATVSAEAKDQFPDDALRTPGAKITAMIAQGFGRFGPAGPPHTDSTLRFDPRQDRGAWVWTPLVFLGMLGAGWRGYLKVRLGEIPGEWCLLLYALVALITVTAFIPLAWDRYYLSIQAGNALMVGVAREALFDTIRARRTGGSPA
ncbi:MAG: phospholipid carrier-dependent glycosyltransferase [Isosphaeraceae bacterium]